MYYRSMPFIPRAGRFARLTPVLVAFGFCVLFCSLCHAELVDRILAIVNDDIILLSDFEKFTQSYREKLKSEGQSEARIRILLADQQSAILDKMIEDKLTEQQAKKYGIKVSDEEVTANIERIKQANGMSQDDLVRALGLSGMSFDSFQDQIREQVLQSRLLNREVRSKIVVTDQDVKEYYEAHREQYATKSAFHLRHILMKVPADDPDGRARVLQQMQQIHQQLETGKSFADLAKVYSQSTSAAEGGDLGTFESRLLATPIRKALEGLKTGQFTGVLDTEQGYQIFYVQDFVQTGGKTMAEATPEIQDQIYKEMLDKKFKEWLKQLREKAHIEILE